VPADVLDAASWIVTNDVEDAPPITVRQGFEDQVEVVILHK
jgi:hypothetical protein